MKVSIHIRIKTAAGWRYCEPVMAENHRLKPQYALVDGNEEKHTEGVYFLRYVSSGKRTWERVGTDAAAAVTMKKKRELAAIDPTAVAPDATTEGMNVQAAATEYLAEVKVAKSERLRRSLQGPHRSIDQPQGHPGVHRLPQGSGAE